MGVAGSASERMSGRHFDFSAAMRANQLMADSSPDPTGASDLAAKLLATFDSISGYTIFAIAVASAAVLTLPSPLFGIDLGPARTGVVGAAIAAVGILAICLAVGKILRAFHESRSGRFRNGRGRFVFVISQTMSFWQGNQSPKGPVLQVHLQGTLTNPNTSRGLIISRLEFFRLTPLGIFSKRECLNFRLSGQSPGPFGLETLRPRHSAVFIADHFHSGRHPQSQRHLWFCLQIVDQRNRRSRVLIRLRHVHTQR
jgi:hypothetical protein